MLMLARARHIAGADACNVPPGFSGLAGLAELAGGFVCDAFEDAAEVVGVRIAAGLGDVGDGSGGFQEELLGAGEAVVFDVVAGGLAGGLFEGVAEGGVAHAGGFGEMGDGDGFGGLGQRKRAGDAGVDGWLV